MSTTRINGKDGVVIAGSKYLELPKGTEADRPDAAEMRPGMIRYNIDNDTNKQGIQVVIGVAAATGKPSTLEWRGVAVINPTTGKIDSSSLPASVLGSASYQGSWNAATNTPPIGVPGTAGRYYIVGVPGNGNGAANLVPADVAVGYKTGDWVVSTGTQWDKIDYNAITTDASSVSLTTTSYNGRHDTTNVNTVQVAFDNVVNSAVDRIRGDVIEGTITFNNASASAYLRLKSGAVGTPGLSFSTDTNTGIFSPGADNMAFSAGGVEIARVNTTAASFAKPIYAITGVASAPSYAFTGATTTGMFYTGGNLGFSIGGTTRLLISSNYTELTTVRVDDGTAVAPSITFKANTNTGMYRVGTDTIGLSTKGVKAFEISPTQATVSTPISTVSGAVNAPSMSFNTDLRSGIYQPSINNVSIATEATQRLNISSAGIQSTVPFVAPSGTVALPSITFVGDTNTGLFKPANELLAVSASGVEVTRFTKDYIQFTRPALSASGSVALPSYSFSGDNNTGFYRVAEGTVGFSSNGVLALSISASGVVSNNMITVPSGNQANPGLVFSGNTDSGLFSNDATSVGITVDKLSKLDITTTDITSNVALRVQGGTSALPGLSLAGDPNTGVYSSAADNIGITAGGVAILGCSPSSIQVNKPIYITRGTSAVPSYSFAGDSNVGIFSPAAGQVALGVNGAKLTALAGSVNLTVPIYAANGTATAPGYAFASDGNIGMYRVNTDQLGFTAGGVNTMTIHRTKVSINQPVDLGVSTPITWTGSLAGRASAIKATGDSTSIQFEASNATEPYKFGSAFETFMTIHPNALLIPVGTAAQVTTAINGMIQYDATAKRFAGYRNGVWIELGADTVDTARNALKFENKTYAQARSDIRAGLLTANDTISNATTAANAVKFDNKTYQQIFDAVRVGVALETGTVANATNATTAKLAVTATTANNALAFNGKTYAQTYTDIRTGLLATSGKAADSFKLEGKTLAQVIADAQSGMLTSSSTTTNAAKLNNMTYDQVKADILAGTVANATKFNNLTYAQVKADIVASKSADTGKFDGKTYAQVKSDILASTGTATNTTNFDGKTYAQVKSDILSGTVTNATNATNTTNFNGKSYAQVKADILAGKSADTAKLEGNTLAQVLASARNGVLLNNGTGDKLTLKTGLQLPTTSDGSVDMLVGPRITNGDVLNGLHTPSSHLTMAAGGIKMSCNAFGDSTLMLSHMSARVVGDLRVDKSISCNGEISGFVSSDRNIKKDIIAIDNASSKVCQLGGYTYEYINDQYKQGKQYGLIAQDVEAIMPELVEDHDGIKRIKSGDNAFIALLAQAHKEQTDRVTVLENEVQELKALVQLLLTK